MKLRLVLFLLIMSGCGPLFGTGTGNPYKFSEPANGIWPQSRTDNIYETVCHKIAVCHVSSVPTECRAFVNAQITYANPLGLTINPAPTAYEIVQLEEKGQITADEAAASICAARVDALSCANAVVQAAFVSGNADPYAASASMLPLDCKAVFSP